MSHCRNSRVSLTSSLLALIFLLFFSGSCLSEAGEYNYDSSDRFLNFLPVAGYGERALDLDLEPQANSPASGEVDGAAGRHSLPPFRQTGPETPGPDSRVMNLQAQDQGPELEWEKRYGGTSEDIIRFVQQTSDNGYIMVGDTYLPSNGGSDVYLVKTDASGNVVWQRNFGGAGHDCGYCVRQTPDGGYIVVGDTNSSGAGGYDMYLIKTSASGSKQWEKTFGGAGNDYGSSVWVNSDGTFILAGETFSYGEGYSDIYMVKVNASGTKIWGKYTGGNNHDWAASVLTTGDGGIVIAGGTMSGGAEKIDVLLCKINSSADTVLWGWVIGGAEDDAACDLEQTGDGGFAVAGYTASAGVGGEDAYLIKMDASGNRQWENYYGGQYNDGAMSVRQTADGGYLLGGWTRSFGAASDFYLVKTDAAGEKLWEKTHSGSDDDYGNYAIQTADGGFALAGETYSTESGWGDGVLVKYRAGGVAGDMNGDQIVSILDLLWMSRWLGPVSNADSQKADVNGDGKVNILDLQEVSALMAPGPTGPVISGISPASGPAGTPVDIAGSGFGPSQGSSTVTFNGVAAPVTAWSDTLIKAVVPDGAGSGNVVVTVGGIASNGVYFDVSTGGETVLESQSKVIGPAGGSITLTDGAALAVAPGALDSNATFTFKKIGNERYYDAPNRLAYDLTSSAGPVAMTLNFPAEAGQPEENIAVLRYNTDTLDADRPAFQYNSGTGMVTVNLPDNVQNAKMDARAAGQNPYHRWIVEWAEELTGFVEGEKLIPMPFYEQVDETCWAADALMLTKAVTPYKDREKEAEIYNFMKALNIGAGDGIGMTAFLKSLLQPIHDFSGGAGVTSSNYISSVNLRCKLVELLKKDLPVILRLTDHTVVVVGYRITSSPSGVRNYEFVIHDSMGINPPNTKEGSMYTTRNWTWFESRLSSISNAILWVDNKPHTQRALQTIGLPSAGKVGDLRFVVEKNGANFNYNFTFDPGEAKGYAWYFGTNKVDAIPAVAKNLYMRLPLWNADLDSSASVKVEIKIRQKDSPTIIYTSTDTVSIPTDKNPRWFTKTIPLCTRLKAGDPKHYLEIRVEKAGTYLDGFTVEFNMEQAPVICDIDPAEAEAGTAVTITGRGFGATRGSSKVAFNGTPAREIVSWSPTSIIARVPGGATTGDVVVTVEGEQSNGLPFEVQPTDLVYPVRISYVSGQNHNMEELKNRKGRIKIGTGATGLWLMVEVQNEYGGYETWWNFYNRTQQGVIEDTEYWRRTQDMVETVDLTGTGFQAKLDSDSNDVYKVTQYNPVECYHQYLHDAYITGTVSAGKASGTIHWSTSEVNTCTSLDKSLFYNYSFVPDV